ncbi:translocation/assembly module TamB domain-containing protein [Sphingomicrobium astaxanthinifaciens]|uniref:translocation/assembly module TamB domain-containing protein n=1 Tax=Sphingomicrobium astaxanthinifaciens TaxID=1227949 RepID=UPI001FCC1848|nr:translocation/assembly module TamB domain-containing protein [Sphingomicrobium astaxanthinifaciens]MCJ7420544.1 translocation/assembly module TamB domain-containing protein [Sphingomicrobium astaxanthinifaciens]
MAAAGRKQGTGRKSLPRRAARRFGKELLTLVLILVGLAAIGLLVLDSGIGHRFIADRIAAMEREDCLEIRIGRIEGSIYDEMVLRNVELRDPQGEFVTISRAEVDWSPLAWLYNDLHIDRLHADLLTVRRLPELCPVERDPDQPLLPGFDIHVGDLVVERLLVEEAVTGTAREGRVEGAVTVRSGRALARLEAALEGGDRVALDLDAEPDADRFDLSLVAEAPADGLLPQLLGLDAPLALEIAGEGSWTDWRGRASGGVGQAEAIDLAIALSAGTYRLEGRVDLSGLVEGVLAEPVAGGVGVEAAFTFEEGVIAGEAMLTSRAMRLVADGGVDLRDNRFEGLDLGLDLRRPEALFDGLGGERLRLVARLDGGFSSFAYDYRLTSPELRVDAITLFALAAEGSGRWSRPPRRVPLTASARRVVGLGLEFEQILENFSLETMLVVSDTGLRSENLRFRSAKGSGTGELVVDFDTGAIDFALNARLDRYLVPGLGLVDVETDLALRPGGGGLQLDGRATATVRRLDNSFFAGLLGGNPVIETRIARGADGVIRFADTRLESPLLALSGSGLRRNDGTFRFEAEGTHESYGPLSVIVDGRISRPSVELFLESPNAALGLRDVTVTLDPNDRGFAYAAEGMSRFGPFTSEGDILLPAGEGQAAIDVAALRVAGSSGWGRLGIVPGGFDGTLALAGGEIAGTLAFSVPAGTPAGVSAQRIAMDLAFDNAAFPGPPAIAARSGRLDGVVLLTETGIGSDFDFALERATIAGLDFERVSGSGRLENGKGVIDAALEGRGRSDFSFDLAAQIDMEVIEDPGQSIVLSGSGSLDGRRLAFVRPARFEMVDGQWVLGEVDLRYGRGRARVSGLTDGGPVEIALSGLPLRLADLFAPDLGLSGTLSGTASYDPRTRDGEASLQVRGLSRAGLLLASRPIDMAVNARIAGDVAGARIVMEHEGESIGRAQVRFAPLPEGPIASALLRAPLFAQFRFDGPAGTLWRLSNVELFDLTGPIRVALDARGSLLRPRISGTLQLSNARLESPVTGTEVTGLEASGRFRGSRLIIDRMSGRTRDGGQVRGSGDFVFLPGGIGIDLGITTERARLLNRDDIAATVSGPLRIRSASGTGGTISGDLTLIEGRYQLGQAGRVAAVPSLEVIERGADPDSIIETARIAPWRLDVGVSGGPLFVKGLGLDSRWTTDVRIGGSVLEPRIRGSADLQSGEYSFAGRRFRVERGDIDFTGNSPPNPSLDILAVADGVGIEAQVRVTGNALAPNIEFASPGIADQDEILSRLLFGTSAANLSAAELVQLGAAVASLQGGGGGLDPINAVRSAIGLDRLRILPADVTTGQQTAIGAGKYITRRLYVEVITDGQGYTATQAEFQVTRWLAILASVNSLGRAGVNARFSRDY